MQRSCCLPCCSLRLLPRHKPICSKTGSDFRYYGNPSVGVHPVLREVCNLFYPAVGPPSSRKGSFRQRVIVSHVGFDRPTVIVTEGYGAAYALNPKYREELSELLDANMILWNTVISWNPPLSPKTGNTSPPRILPTTCTPSATPLKASIPANGLRPASARADRLPCSTARSIRTTWIFPCLM